MANIIFIGFMGSGKSSMGRYMMNKYGYTHIDTDEYIEQQQKRTINDIFANEGEAYFRDLETKCINDILAMDRDDLIIAVGGGLPMSEVNQKLLKKLGRIVYLRASEDTLVNRLKGDKKRPLLQNGDLRDRIRELFNRREETYIGLSDVIVDTDNCSYEAVYTDIMEGLK